MLGAFNAGRLVDQDSQGFSSTVKSVGKQTGIGLVQRVVDVIKLGSLGYGEYILSMSLYPCQSLAGGEPTAAWEGPNIKISKTEFRNAFRRVMFIGSGNYRKNDALPGG